jgi:hypothetical protein
VFGALAEVIDNSFGGNTGNADTVVITHNKRTLTVLDNGRGLEHLHFVFQLGGGSGDRAGDIGRYGVGGTEAGLYLADKVDVWTMRDGKSCHHSVDWVRQIEVGQYPKITESWKEATAANTPSELFELGHGTIIRFHLQKGRIVRPPQVRQRLAEMFRSRPAEWESDYLAHTGRRRRSPHGPGAHALGREALRACHRISR